MDDARACTGWPVGWGLCAVLALAGCGTSGDPQPHLGVAAPVGGQADAGKIDDGKALPPGVRGLCDPCDSNLQCSEVGASCVGVGKPPGSQGYFCLTSCTPLTGCPTGYHCDTSSAIDGSAGGYCLPDGNVCGCSSQAAQNAWSTSCFQVAYDPDGVPLASCPGTWACSAAGKGGCDAKLPKAETCDGTDDDCDGQTDESEGKSLCDDGNPCTSGEACQGGKCAPGTLTCACQSDADCAQQQTDKCAGTLVCDPTSHQCKVQPGTQVVCTGSACVQAVCDPGTGQCQKISAQVGTPCDDGDACTSSDACQAGTCVPGKTLACDDGNPCTVDACDAKGGCQHSPAPGKLCDDGNPCTQGDACQNGKCAAGVAKSCDDDNPCTTDECKGGQCSHTPLSGPCDADGSLCTQGDACSGGKCVAGKAMACDDGNVCTVDGCNPKTGKCTYDPKPLTGKPCSDDNACTQGEKCQGAACKGGAALACDDGEPCTQDACDPKKGCVFLPDSGPCDDGNPCTADDACQGGTCHGKSVGCECASDEDCLAKTGGNLCLGKMFCNTTGRTPKCQVVPGTAVTCSGSGPCASVACVPATGKCQSQPAADGKVCSDGNACTQGDQCLSGACKGGAAVTCNDGNPCTADSCDPSGGCENQPSEGACNDGDACSTGDACSQGTCAAGALLSCDDKIACTTDSCDPAKGCVHVAQAAACDDGSPCTTDTCQLAKGCVHTALSQACDDGNACTTADKCEGGVCKPGAAKSCDDGNPCTTDACDAKTGCSHVATTATCSDGNACTTGDKCEGGVCKPGTGMVCDDGKPCTADTCVSGTCQHDTAAMEGKPCPPQPNCTGQALCTDGKCNAPAETCQAGVVTKWPWDVPSKFGPATSWFDPVGYHTISLTLPKSEWDAYLAEVLAGKDPDKWYEATAVIDGQTYAKVGIRKFGYGSMLDNPGKPNIRVKFDQFMPELEGPDGLHNIRLKASGQDPTFLREPLAYVVARAGGGIAPRTTWARVKINDEPYGLYQVIEQADERMFKANFDNKSGNNYEPKDGCVGLNCPPEGCAAVKYYYESDVGDKSEIVALVAAIHSGADEVWVDKVAALANLDAMLTFFAMDALITNFDGMTAAGHNFEVYVDKDTGKIFFIAGGQDLTWGNWNSWYDLMAPWGYPASWCKERKDDFYTRALATPKLKQQLLAKLQDLRCGPASPEVMLPTIDKLKAILKTDLYLDPKGQWSQASIDKEFGKLKTYVTERAKAVDSAVGPCE